MTVLVILAVIAVMASLVAFAGAMLRRHGGKPTVLRDDDRRLVTERWGQVEMKLQGGGPSQIRQAIIDADTLVDHSMKRLGVSGDTMGERLRQAEGRFTDYDGLWKAHKVRNQLVHEMDREVLSFEAKKIIARFQTALRDLGAIDA